MDLLKKLNELGAQALADLDRATSLEVLENVRLSVLGKKGSLSEVLRGLGQVEADARREIGAVANRWKTQIEEKLDARLGSLKSAAQAAQLEKERLDITLPARVLPIGTLHPITTISRRLTQVFSSLGFEAAVGPEVETEFMNFEAANIPADHPARDMQDTFFLAPGVVLRTHTTAIQMRAMRTRGWPLRITCTGAVYRSDSDATHLPMFHQMEGLWVDRGVKMSDLRGVLATFARAVFGDATRIRLRPSYFPFVEPGAEVDVSCFSCKDKPVSTCRVCKGSGWLEILGAGMVHPRLFELAGFGESTRLEGLTGFAFGLGIERIAMLVHQIPDLRLMYSGDQRFLGQFGGRR